MSSRKNILALGCMGLTGLLLTVGAAQAQTENPAVKVGLDARFRYESSVDKDLKNRADFFSMRARPNLTYTLNSNSSFFIQPQMNKVLGAGVFNPTGAAANTYADSSGNSSYQGDAVTIHQAYFDIGFNESLKLIAGRQELSYGDQLMLSASNWGIYGRTFDAAKLRWMDGKSFIDVLHSKLAQVYDSSFSNDADKSMSGIYASWNINDTFKALDLYSLYVTDDRQPGTTGTGSGTASTALAYYGANGVRLVTEFGNFAFKTEYAQNFGGTPSGFLDDTSEAYMSNSEFIWNFKDTMANQLSLEVFVAGKNWRDLFNTTHYVLGLTDVFGRRNLTGAGLHYSGNVTEKWNLMVDLYSFQRTSTDNPAYATNTRTAVGDITVSDSKDLGMELDLRAKYKLDQNMSFFFSLAAMQPGTFLTEGAGKDKTPTYASIMFDTKL